MLKATRNSYLMLAAAYSVILFTRCLLVWRPPAGFYYNIDELEMTLTCVDRFLGLPPTSLQWPGSILQLLFLPVLIVDFVFHAGVSLSIGTEIGNLATYVSRAYTNPVHSVTLLRLTVAAISSTAPLLGFGLGLSITKSQSAAWLCGALMVFPPVFWEQSAMAMSEGVSIAFLMAALLLVVRFPLRFSFLAGFLFAGAMAARVTVTSVVLAPLLLLALQAGAPASSRLRGVLRFAAGVAIGFLFWCPFVWTDPVRFAKALAGHLHGGGGFRPGQFIANWINGLGFAFSAVAFISFAGALVAAVKSERLRGVAIAGLVGLGTVAFPLLTARDVFPRYFLPVLPCVLLFAAVTLSVAWRAPNLQRVLGTVFGLAVVGMFAEGAMREVQLRAPDELAQALQANASLHESIPLYLPQEALYLYRIPVPGSVYVRMRERAAEQMRESEGLFRFLKMRGIPEQAGKILKTDFNEDEQALNARLAAAAANEPGGQPLFFYFDPATIDGIAGERLTPADFTIGEAIARVRAGDKSAILLRNPSPELGVPLWKGAREWYLYRH